MSNCSGVRSWLAKLKQCTRGRLKRKLHHRSEVQAPFPSGQTRCCAIMMAYITRDPPVIHCTSTRRYQREHQMADEDEQRAVMLASHCPLVSFGQGWGVTGSDVGSGGNEDSSSIGSSVFLSRFSSSSVLDESGGATSSRIRCCAFLRATRGYPTK
ncbi:hypothetical protein EV363DRAFT_1430136 [Boletus edulis]|nr:hypothetical protein EV363DRAFT_1430136 [Boletus edulis]